MFNYGVQFGDKEITNDDDGTSGRFDLSQTVYFFKEPVGYVQVMLLYAYTAKLIITIG